MVLAWIPRRVRDGNIRLRPLRIFDGPFMRDAFRERDVFEPNGLSEPIEGSWFEVWWWLRRAFVFSYCIEIDSRLSGFVGFYKLFPGQYAEVALTLFDRRTRGQGYGRRVLALLERTLERRCRVERVVVRVKEENHGAAGFWKKVGFEAEGPFGQEGVILMSKNLKNNRWGQVQRPGRAK
jgi:RimJ/RimL family protein N-acetyltransferase